MENMDTFKQIILSFQLQGLMALGRIEHPYTKKSDKKPEIAQNSIEMLENLKEKTKGNLNNDEESFLNEAISNLKMLYVEEIKKGERAGEKSEE
jgi:hypothetical protein